MMPIADYGYYEYKIENCVECYITETDTDFTAELVIADAPGSSANPYEPALRDIVRIQHADGNWYEFKVDTLSYSYTNQTYSLTAKYLAYETGGVINERLFGMYTPRTAISNLQASLHGGEIRTTVFSNISDERIPLAISKPQTYRTSLYSNIANACGYHLKPTNMHDLELVRTRGSTVKKHLGLGSNVIDLSYDESVGALPTGIVYYAQNPNGDYPYWSETYNYLEGEYDLYDATEEIKELIDLDQDVIDQFANQQYEKMNPKGLESAMTVKASLTPNAPALAIGDHVDMKEIYGYDLTVSEIRYDVLNEYITDVTLGDFQQNVTDIIANKKSVFEGLTAYWNDGIYLENIPSTGIATITLRNWRSGDILEVIPDYGYSVIITNISGSTATIKFTDEDKPAEVWVSWTQYREG